MVALCICFDNAERLARHLGEHFIHFGANRKNPVRMKFDGSLLQLSCITAIGKSYDECVYEGTVDNLEIGFNNRYLLDALRACPDGTVNLSVKGSLNPIVFTPEEGSSFTYLVLPVRLKSNE